MSRSYFIIFSLLLSATLLSGQVQYNIDYNETSGVYTLSMESAVSYTGPFARLSSSSQLTLVFPHTTGGFQITNLTDLQPGTTPLDWSLSRLDAPAENPGSDYLFFAAGNSGSYTPFDIPANTRLDLFSFESNSGCLGSISIFDNTNDPLLSNGNLNPGNNFVVLGGGNQNQFTTVINGTATCINCEAGSIAPVLSGTTVSNTCPSTTANLGSLVTSTAPTGTAVAWHTVASNPGPLNEIINPSFVDAGTYYAYYHDSTNDCYSPASAAVTVTIDMCTTPGVTYCLTRDENTGVYTVAMTANESITGPFARLSNSSQATLVFPHTTGGFQISNLTNLTALNWGTSRLDAPTENTAADYMFFAPSNAGTYTPFDITANTSIDLFSFESASGCLGDISIFDNDADPLNSNLSLNPDNNMVILGGGLNNLYAGNTCTTATCCLAGNVAPTLSTTTASNVCAATTVDLDALHTGTAPTGTTLVWSTDDDGTDGLTSVEATSTAIATDGTYYAYYWQDVDNSMDHNTGDCYSPASTGVVVTMVECCAAGTAMPSLSATTAMNTCPATTANIAPLVTSTSPTGAAVAWHTVDNNPGPTTLVSNPTFVDAGTYYAYYHDSANDCYSPASAAVTVTIDMCTTPGVTYCLTRDENTGVYTVAMTANETITGPFARLSNSSQATLVFPHTTGGFQISNFTNLTALNWGTSRLDAPTENTTADYMFFAPSNAGTYTPFDITANTSIDLFSFESASGCLGDISIFDNDADPLNSNLSLNPDNNMVILGGGLNNLYSGNTCTTATCCLAGKVAPPLSANTALYICAATTVHLDALHTGTAPTGTTLVWSTDDDGSDGLTSVETTSTVIAADGTYYAYYWQDVDTSTDHNAGDCYSPASVSLAVTVTACCDAGTAAPLLSAAMLMNSCPATTADILTISASNTPASGTNVLEWHTSATVMDASTLYATPAGAAPGTYYATFHDTANDCYSPVSSGVVVTIEDCCDAGTAAPLLSAAMLMNNCPATTADISTISASNTPASGTNVLEWHTSATVMDASTLYATPAAAAPGTYYATFHDTANDCYSPVSSGLVVTIEDCCVAGTAMPVLSATSAMNTCPATTANIAALVTSTPLSGASVVWHTVDNNPGPTTLVSNATFVPAGTYYAYYHDTAVDCYSPASAAVTVTIDMCTTPGVTYCLTRDENTGVYTVAMTANESITGPFARLSNSSQATLVFPHTTGGFQISNLTNLTALNWGTSRLDAPTENTAADYMFFAPSNAGTYTPFDITANTSIDLFSFESASGCLGDISIFDNDADPLNSNLSLNPDNNMVILGGGLNNLYSGNTCTTATCCLAGNVAPTLSATTASNVCAATTVDLDALHTGTAPTGTTLVWSTDDDGSDGLTSVEATSTAIATDGTYYAYYWQDTDTSTDHNTGDCYSPASASVVVTIVVCCDAGTDAPILSAATLMNTCPATTADLSTISASNTPASGTNVLEWHTSATVTDDTNLYATPSSATAGTYYAIFHDTANDCYSPTSTGVVLTIGTCCAAGTAMPMLSATTAMNNCPATTADIAALVTSTPPTGATVVWHTVDNNPGPTTLVANATFVPAGTYYAYYHDTAVDCYSPASAAVTVTIDMCATPGVTYCLTRDENTGVYTIAMTANESITGPFARLSNSSQVTLVFLHTTGGFQISNLTNLTALNWGTSRLDAPTENTAADYMFFAPSNAGTYTPFDITANTSIDLFTFESSSGCLGDISIFDNVADPLNSNLSLNPDNNMVILGGGLNNLYTGNTCTTAACCTAGEVAPTLSATTISNVCPVATVDLDALHTGTAPTGTTLVWSTDDDGTDGLASVEAAPTAIDTDGTYYAYYWEDTDASTDHNTADCYSPASSGVTVTMTVCCDAGTASPMLSAITLMNTCPATTADLSTITASNTPTGTITLEWHTSSTVTDDTNLYDTPTTAVAGTYYAVFHDTANDCYSPVTSEVIVTIEICCDAGTASPMLSANMLSNVCDAALADLTSITASNTPASGTNVLEWHTSSTVTDASTLYATPTAAVADTYYGVFHDTVNDCYSPVSAELIVTLVECCAVDGLTPAIVLPGN